MIRRIFLQSFCALFLPSLKHVKSEKATCEFWHIVEDCTVIYKDEVSKLEFCIQLCLSQSEMEEHSRKLHKCLVPNLTDIHIFYNRKFDKYGILVLYTGNI